jgi:hypothetical protein
MPSSAKAGAEAVHRGHGEPCPGASRSSSAWSAAAPGVKAQAIAASAACGRGEWRHAQPMPTRRCFSPRHAPRRAPRPQTQPKGRCRPGRHAFRSPPRRGTGAAPPGRPPPQTTLWSYPVNLHDAPAPGTDRGPTSDHNISPTRQAPGSRSGRDSDAPAGGRSARLSTGRQSYPGDSTDANRGLYPRDSAATRLIPRTLPTHSNSKYK